MTSFLDAPSPAARLMEERLRRMFTDLQPRLERGEMRRAYGRDAEIGEVLRLLQSPLPRHPVLLGRSGVGKTALMYQIADLVRRGDCPEPLRGMRLLQTSPRQLLGALPAGEAAMAALRELWSTFREGGPALVLLQNAQEAADYPELAATLADLFDDPGEAPIRILAEARADRWSHLQTKVTAYTRVFVPVSLREIEDEALDALLRAACADLEAEYGVAVAASARERAVDLTQRYIPTRAQPGKAFQLLEETLATRAGAGDGLAEIGAREVTERFSTTTQLPMMLLDDAVLWDEEAVRGHLQGRVLGQELAVEATLQRLSLLKAGIHDPRRPLGVFFFLGPTGVGKTELAKALASFLFGRDDQLVRLNMTDYSEPWQFSELFGVADPDEPIEQQRGQLAVRLGDQLFTVLLLDEFEKAHANIFQRFLQLFDEGILINGAGEEVNVRNSIIILTSNLASSGGAIEDWGFARATGGETLEQRVMRSAESFFAPEFLNRIDGVVFFHPLDRATVRRIAFRELNDLFRREGLARRGIRLEWDDSVVDWILDRGYSERYGARFLRRQIEKSVSYSLARALITQPVPRGSHVRIYVMGGPRGQIKAKVLPPDAEVLAGNVAIDAETRRRVVDIAGIKAALPELRARVERVAGAHASPAMRAERDHLLEALGRPDFWDDVERGRRQMQALGALSARIELVDALRQLLDDIEVLVPEIYGASDHGKIAAVARVHGELQTNLDRAELDLHFVDDWDPLDAWITITAGGGGDGTSAAWAAEVVEMYLAWARSRGFEPAVVDESVAPGGKVLLRARLRVAGYGAFALLRHETGAHRLVEGVDDGGRATRHANVVVWPLVDPDAHPLLLADLQLDGAAAGGRGNFLKRLRSRVTVTHRPSNRMVECAGEGSLGETEALALELMRARIVAEEQGIGRDAAGGEWGDVARVYHRHREQGVRDVRTGVVLKSIRNVLAGRIDPFLQALLERRRDSVDAV